MAIYSGEKGFFPSEDCAWWRAHAGQPRGRARAGSGPRQQRPWRRVTTMAHAGGQRAYGGGTGYLEAVAMASGTGRRAGARGGERHEKKGELGLEMGSNGGETFARISNFETW